MEASTLGDTSQLATNQESALRAALHFRFPDRGSGRERAEHGGKGVRLDDRRAGSDAVIIRLLSTSAIPHVSVDAETARS